MQSQEKILSLWYHKVVDIVEKIFALGSFKLLHIFLLFIDAQNHAFK